MSFTISNNHHCLWTFVLFLLLLLLLVVPSLSLNSDGTNLLSFRYSVLSDPLSVLENWNYNDETPCLWTGVTCGQVDNSAGIPDMFRVISLVLPSSKLLGSVPEDLGFIEHLRTLDLSNNFLNGTLPSSLFNASELHVLSLSSNKIFGELPSNIEGFKSLKLLNLSDNALGGKMPENLTSLQNLTVVSLRSNYFSGPIPNGFQFVEVLDLSSNLLNGSLPDDLGGESLRYLNLSYNKLSGLVSPKFAKKVPANATLDLSFNNLKGEIPESVALSNQKAESFAGNVDLCGKPLKKLCTIPSSLSTPPNVSTNTSPPAIAAIPRTIYSTSITNSSQSQAETTQNNHGLNPGTVAGIAIGDLAGIAIIGMIFLYVYQQRKKNKNETNTNSCEKEHENESKEDKKGITSSWSCLSIGNGGETSEATGSESEDNNKIGYHEKGYEQTERTLLMVDGETELEPETLLKASAYMLGSSGQSIVYKAVLEDGTAFAVRRIGESGVVRLKEFESKVRAIAKLKHPNLVRIRGFYWGDDEKLVIYDFVSNGSLASSSGYRKMGSSPYHHPFEARLKIARGLARGLTYIHDKKHVHGSIKPTNILLTSDMEPLISDFGLDWIIYGKHSYKIEGSSTRHFESRRCSSSGHPHGLTSSSSSNSTTSSPYITAVGFVGCTSPYHAPESLKSPKPNSKWDVYSFGIVLLELLTGQVFSDRELRQWTTGGGYDSVVEDKIRLLMMVDVAIRADVEQREDATLACFKLGFSCASLVPQKRPSMKDALQVLEKFSWS